VHLLRASLVTQCHVPTWKVRDQKQILRHRENLVQNRTKIANRLHNLLDKYDIQIIGTHMTVVKNLQWLAEQKLPRVHDDYVDHQCVRQIRPLNCDIKELEKTIDKLALQNEDVKIGNVADDAVVLLSQVVHKPRLNYEKSQIIHISLITRKTSV